MNMLMFWLKANLVLAVVAGLLVLRRWAAEERRRWRGARRKGSGVGGWVTLLPQARSTTENADNTEGGA